MQIKITMRHHLTPLGWLLSKTQKVTSIDKDVKKLESLWWECKMVQLLWETVWKRGS